MRSSLTPGRNADPCSTPVRGTVAAGGVADLPPGGLWLFPREVRAEPDPTPTSDCAGQCTTPTPMGTVPAGWTTFFWSLFHVRPRLSGTEQYLVWQEFDPGSSCPPIWVRVQWGHRAGEVHVETMRIDGDCNVIEAAPNIFWHWIGTKGCDGARSASDRILENQTLGCVTDYFIDIDWNAWVGGKHWDWVYFWIPDPDTVSLKALYPGQCPSPEWPLEYVNNGPKYTRCQVFSNRYWHAHGINGIEVEYDVLYQPGQP